MTGGRIFADHNIITSNSFLKKACPASAFFFKELTNSIFYTRIMCLSTADTIFAIIQLQQLYFIHYYCIHFCLYI